MPTDVLLTKGSAHICMSKSMLISVVSCVLRDIHGFTLFFSLGLRDLVEIRCRLQHCPRCVRLDQSVKPFNFHNLFGFCLARENDYTKLTYAPLFALWTFMPWIYTLNSSKLFCPWNFRLVIQPAGRFYVTRNERDLFSVRLVLASSSFQYELFQTKKKKQIEDSNNCGTVFHMYC